MSHVLTKTGWLIHKAKTKKHTHCGAKYAKLKPTKHLLSIKILHCSKCFPEKYKQDQLRILNPKGMAE